MRLTVRQCSRYFKRYVEREVYKESEKQNFIPLRGWQQFKRRTWHFDESRPWTADAKQINRYGDRFPGDIGVRPLTSWHIFKGDVTQAENHCSPASHQPQLHQRRRHLHTRSMSSTSSPDKPRLLGLGNPLLDITVRTDKRLLDRYGLAENDAVIAHDDLLQRELFAEIQRPDNKPIYGAGGATQNAIRVAQWLLGNKGSTSFIGCVGDDKQGEILRAKANSDGVDVRYLVDPHHSTGVCGALITGDQRSLVAHLGAAEHLRSDWLRDDVNWALVRQADAIYMAAFLFETCPEAIHAVLDHSIISNKLVAMNLSSEALCRFFTATSSSYCSSSSSPTSSPTDSSTAHGILASVDLLFGNGVEMSQLCRNLGMNFGLDFKRMAMALVNMEKFNLSRKRIVVITRGTRNTVVANGYDDTVGEYEIDAISRDDIKDTNGCGDAFVGGFMSQLLLRQQRQPEFTSDLVDCIRCGHYAAHTVVQQWGCNYTRKPQFHSSSQRVD